jgi:hypothetical protein
MSGPEGKLRGRPPPPVSTALRTIGVGRGLDPTPDERGPARATVYDERIAGFKGNFFVGSDSVVAEGLVTYRRRAAARIARRKPPTEGEG